MPKGVGGGVGGVGGVGGAGAECACISISVSVSVSVSGKPDGVPNCGGGVDFGACVSEVGFDDSSSRGKPNGVSGKPEGVSGIAGNLLVEVIDWLSDKLEGVGGDEVSFIAFACDIAGVAVFSE
eukprot:TRINITY_DN5605_c0_g5_i1.p2 TRINITY_DN5605_c0_g5~~TRINITY_DN5605_c0_g5_i1.p2  ORF type:complete len:124 (-),score=27.40 TRINITY_DN5605_c0_g5_i1:174-545(-)